MSEAFLTHSPVIEKLLQQAKRLAKSSATVLIAGESGSGKEVLSKYIHQASNRKGQPYMALNCAAFPENLLESELFGSEKGAYTGAVEKRRGLIESAQGGTVLLDEIHHLPLQMQAKLLRVLQEKEIRPIGSNNSKKVDVRFIATTNENLKHLVCMKKFRQDLYFRLNVIPLNIPPLRSRQKDIALLTDFFVGQICKDNDLNPKKLSAGALEKIGNWTWPGNVRELQNVLERSLLLSESDILSSNDIHIDESHLVEEPILRTHPEPGMTLKEAEMKLIQKTLEFTHQNRSEASRLLGINVRTLRKKLNEEDSNKVGSNESDL